MEHGDYLFQKSFSGRSLPHTSFAPGVAMVTSPPPDRIRPTLSTVTATPHNLKDGGSWVLFFVLVWAESGVDVGGGREAVCAP